MLPLLLAAADAAPFAGLDASNPVIFLGLLIGGAFTCVSLYNQIDEISQRRKRTPAIEAEFVTKEEFQQTLSRFESELKINRIAVEKLTSNIGRDFNTLYRALGKVEGVTIEDRRDSNE